MDLRVEDVSWSVIEKRIIESISFSALSDKTTGIIGPNGSGKTTLLRCLYKIYKPDSGTILLDEKNIQMITDYELARKQAAVLQERDSDFTLSVYNIVLMGRIPYKTVFSTYDEKDFKIVEDALQKVGMEALFDRDFRTLSGGEKQRVLIARALAQKASMIIMDEPTNHLDIRFQLDIMELVSSLNITTLLTLHDLNLASLYCDKLIVLLDGRVYREGVPEDVITPQLIRDVFAVNADVRLSSSTGKPTVSYLPMTGAIASVS